MLAFLTYPHKFLGKLVWTFHTIPANSCNGILYYPLSFSRFVLMFFFLSLIIVYRFYHIGKIFDIENSAHENYIRKNSFANWKADFKRQFIA